MDVEQVAGELARRIATASGRWTGGNLRVEILPWLAAALREARAAGRRAGLEEAREVAEDQRAAYERIEAKETDEHMQHVFSCQAATAWDIRERIKYLAETPDA